MDIDPPTPDTQEALDRKVRRLRLNTSLTQIQLAIRADLSRSTVFKIERGDGASPETLRKLANALGVEPGELLED